MNNKTVCNQFCSPDSCSICVNDVGHFAYGNQVFICIRLEPSGEVLKIARSLFRQNYVEIGKHQFVRVGDNWIELNRREQKFTEPPKKIVARKRFCNLPIYIIGLIFMYAPKDLYKCIKFLRVWPRTLEILWRPNFIKRHDMEALLIRGNIAHSDMCLRHKWKEGYLALHEKFNVTPCITTLSAFDFGIAVHLLSVESMEILLHFFEPHENFVQKFVPEHPLMNITDYDIYLTIHIVPIENIRYWIKNIGKTSPKIFEICIFQNQWDLARLNIGHIPYYMITTFSRERTRRYYELAIELDTFKDINLNLLIRKTGVKKYHIDLLIECGYDKPINPIICNFNKVGFKASYPQFQLSTVKVKRLTFTPNTILCFTDNPLKLFLQNYKTHNLTGDFNWIITHFNKRGLRKFLAVNPPSEETVHFLIEHGYFDFLFSPQLKRKK